MELETELELDQPRESDYKYEELFGSTEKKEGEYNVFYPKTIFNQGAKTRTRMGCSRYGIIHAINAQNLAVQKEDGMRTFEYNPEVMWENYLKINPSAEKDGATLQGALDQMLELSLITGYARLSGIDSMKQSLDSFNPIYTGSKKCNWRTVTNDHKYTLGDGYAHIFCIVGYNESGWIAINSYGKMNGVFYIDFKYTDSLFSCYSLHDSRDADIFANQK